MVDLHTTSESVRFIVQYPVGQTEASDGTIIDNSLIAMKILETMETGGGVAFPIDVDCDGHVITAWQLHTKEPDAWEITKYTPKY